MNTIINWLNTQSPILVEGCDNLTMIGLGLILIGTIVVLVVPKLRKKFF